MGTWGPGPFDNDASLDWLVGYVYNFAKMIDKFCEMKDPLFNPDFMNAYAALGMINLLRVAGSGPIPETQRQKWHNAFFSCFDAEFAKNAKDEARTKEWRNAIEAELKKLER